MFNFKVQPVPVVDVAGLTDDNIPLSKPSLTPCFAINCDPVLPPDVARYLQASVAENTRRAYQSDLEHFAQWGGAIPSTPVRIASYLAAHATTHKVATLRRRLAAIAKAHQDRQLPNPITTPLVKSTLRGIRRMEGMPQQGAAALTSVHLARVVGAMGSSLRDDRDKALLLLGFAAGLRRSELVGLQTTDVKLTSSGVTLLIRRSKCDQNGQGRHITVARHQTDLCPVAALEAWITNAAIKDGPLFRPINRNGRPANHGLSGGAVSLILKQSQ